MSKPIKDNYLTKQNGCEVIEVSSQKDKSPATNILLESQRLIWMTQHRLPQFCIIDTSNMKTYPKIFNRIGFYCWHEYDTNPALIEVAYRDNHIEDWNIVAKIRLTRVSDKQYFKIKDIPANEMKQLKITILENFGEHQTYLNKVQLGFLKETSPIEPNRQKTFSQYVKLTSTQKQLKKAQQQLKKLTNQNQQIKFTVKKQGQMILQMQQAFKLLTKQLEKMHKTQELQNNKIISMLGKEKQLNKNQTQLIDKKRAMIQDSQESQKQRERRYIQDNLISSKTVNNSHSYSKSQRNSYKKSKQSIFADAKHTKYEDLINHSRQRLKKGTTQSQLSEYQASQDERSKYSVKCTEMMSRLQKLIAQRVILTQLSKGDTVSSKKRKQVR